MPTPWCCASTQVILCCLFAERLQDAKINGKSSPFNNISSLEQIVMKGKSPEAMMWIMLSVRDYLQHLPDEFGAQNFSFRQLKGQNSAGYIHLFLTKREIMEHFCANMLAKFPNETFKDFVKQSLTTHEGFRHLCGSPIHEVDLAWQAEYSDAEVLAINFLKNVVYSKNMGGSLKTIIKGNSNIEDVMASQKIAELTSELLEKLDAEINPGKATSGAALLQDDDMEGEAVVSLESLVETDLLQNEETAKELQEHFVAVKEFVSRFITFTPAETSVVKTQQLLDATVIKKMPVKAKFWCLWYDTKNAGESSAQPHCRPPPYQKATFKKHLHAALAAHELTEMDEKVLVMCMDGFRSLESVISKDLVKADGDAMAKSRTTFQIAYDERALRKRKCLNRGLVSQVEGLHVYSADALAISERDRLTYAGSTHGSLIGPVEVAMYQDGFLVSKAVKEKMLGEHGKILAGGPCSQTSSLPSEIGAKLPCSYYSLPEAFYAEVLHSFEIGGVYDATCTDVMFALAAVKAKVPYIGSCLSEYACQVLEAEVVRRVWNEFLAPDSQLYDPALHALVDSNVTVDSAGKVGKKGKGKSKGKGKKGGAGKPEGDNEGKDDAKGSAGKENSKGKSKGSTGKGKGKSKGSTEAEIVKALAALQTTE